MITYIEARAAEDGESAEDWMVCRIVTYEEEAGAVDWEWLPS